MEALTIRTTLEALHYHYDIKKDSRVEKILSLVNEWIEGKVDIETFFNKHIDDVFTFRIYAINWAIKNNFLHEIEESRVFSNTEETRYETLITTANFALKTFEKVNDKLKLLIDKEEVLGDVLLEKASLKEFLHEVEEDSVVKNNIQKWFTYSLGTELGLIVIFALTSEEKNKNRLLSEEKISSLISFVVDYAQSFGGMSRTLGIVKQKNSKISTGETHPEDIFLAEQGIEEFAHELDNQ